MSKTLVSDSETYRLACACIQQDYDYVLTVSPATRCIIQALSSTALGSFFVPGAVELSAGIMQRVAGLTVRT